MSGRVSLWQYMADRWDTLGPQLHTHLQIVVIALAAATAIGLPLGVVSSRRRALGGLILGVTSALLTIPSFALFGVLSVGLGIGNAPVEIGLILYALLPIVRGTQVGLTQLDAAILEAARGMGMRPLQVLRRVAFPLALPLVIAGIRQSTVLVVAIATVGAAVGANDLGQPILAGIRGSDRFAILSGVIPVAVAGILADLLLGGVQRLLSRGRTAVAA